MSETHVHNGDIVMSFLQLITKCDDLSTAQAMAQAALDFATNDEEALEQGRNLQDPPHDH